jgi:hypothetical protein
LFVILAKKLGLDSANCVMYITDDALVYYFKYFNKIANRLAKMNLDKTFFVFKKEMCFSYFRP